MKGFGIMKDYIILTVAVLLQALPFVLTKLYQTKTGGSNFDKMMFAVLSIFGTLGAFAVNGFRMDFSIFSFVLATATAILSTSYTLVGFYLMKSGNLSLYTLFLMTGGMTLPYIYGIVFLGEPLDPVGLFGVILIILAVFLSNTGKGVLTGKQFAACVLVFVLNGSVSIVSKLHQMADESLAPVDASSFSIMSGISKFVICLVVIMFMKPSKPENRETLRKIPSLLIIVFFAGFANTVSYILQLMSASNLPATVVYPFITGGTIILTAVGGVLFFRDELPKKQWIGIAVCFAGTLLLL